MRLYTITESVHLTEGRLDNMLKDPQVSRTLARLLSNDPTVPPTVLARMGPNPTEEDLIEFWKKVLDSTLGETTFGDMRHNELFYPWLTRQYLHGHVDYEDVTGEAGDTLGVWKRLSDANTILRKEHQDFNKFNFWQLQKITNMSGYADHIKRIKNHAEIEKHKASQEYITILDTPRFFVSVLLNYGACYTFNNAQGVRANFCTGSSGGLNWFNRYSKDGVIVAIFDKTNMDHPNGKWQMHAATNQLKNAPQISRGDTVFATEFPGLMKAITNALQAHAPEIKKASAHLTSGGYDIPEEIRRIKTKFPQSYASAATNDADKASLAGADPTTVAEPQQEPEGPGVYRITHNETGRSVALQADSAQDAIQQVLTRYPNMTPDQFRVTLDAAQGQ